MSEHPVPPRHAWLPSALPVLCRPEPSSLSPQPSVIDVVTQFGEAFRAIRDEAVGELARLGEAAAHNIRLDDAPPPVEVTDLDAPMRVVLMGRTMAGKSSLLAALTGSHHDRVGDGRQRFSRDVFGAPLSASEDIEVVDTPGVGARDGAEDFEKAFTAALAADLIVWVASSDSIQEETAKALRLLGLIGKPIVVALNCRQSLVGVGKLNLLRFPERVFGHREGLVDEIRRHMEASAVMPLGVVYLHALAATAAITGDSFDRELHEASRVDDLVEVLLDEHEAHRQSRRTLRLIDSQRLLAQETVSALVSGAGTLSAQAARDRAMTADVHARLARVLNSSQEGVQADIKTVVGRRRAWHLTVTDFGDSLSAAWQAEVAELQDELADLIDQRFSELANTVEEAISDATAEWSTVSAEQFRLGELRGFDEVWGNRLLRAGIGIGSVIAGTWAGAQTGAAIGAASGPGAIVTTAIGGLVGLGVTVALGPLKGLADRLFLGKDGVLRKRREEVAAKVGPILDDLSRTYTETVAAHLDKLRVRLSEERSAAEERSRALDQAAASSRRHGEALKALIDELDRETTTMLLRIAGRERLAGSVLRSTRLPGTCILTEFEPTAFWEAWLFPPDIGERLVPGKPSAQGDAAASSLTYGLGLLDMPARLARAGSRGAVLHIDAHVPPNIAQAWADGLTHHLGAEISIENDERDSNA